MRTIDSRILSGLKSGTANISKRLYLHRRVYSGGAYSFDSAIDVSEYLKDMDTVKFKLDTESYGVFDISNVTITLDNSRGKFKQNNSYGFFPSESSGLLQGSKIVITAGVLLDDGTEVSVAVFTGYIKDKPVYNTEDKTVDFVLSGQMSIFDDYLAETSPNGYNAELISTLVTDELVGSGSGTAFSIANNATGLILAVKKGLTSGGSAAATTLDPSADYSVSNLNEHDAPATVNLEAALNADQSCWVTYRYWYLDKKIEWIVAQICSLCGIAATAISPAIFTNNTKTIFSESGLSWTGTMIGCSVADDASGLLFSASGEYVSPVIDGGVALTSWGQFNSTYALWTPTASLMFYWRDSADASSWSTWAQVSPGNTLPSTARYVQFRFIGTSDPSDIISSQMASWSILHYSSATIVSVVNMTGLTCADALKSLAEICAYEMGFDLSDTFIFRPRSNSSSSIMTMDGDYIAEVTNWDDGRDKIKNVVEVTFGTYTKTADCSTEEEPAPTSQQKYGSTILTISSGNFLPASGVDLAYAIAPTVWQYTSKPRRRVIAKTKFALNLELGDNVTLQVPEPSILRTWKWGDGSVKYGQSDACYYSESMAQTMLSLYNVKMRVEGIEWDMMNWTTTFNFTEVL